MNNHIDMNSEKFVYNILPRLIDCTTHKVLVSLRRLSRTWMYLFRTLNIERITDKYSDKQNKMDAFQAYLMYLPVQGSPEWLAQRSGTNRDFLRELLIKIHGLDPELQFPPTIGGSEIASLLGEDKYKNKAGLLRSKLGLEKFDGNLPTNWGKMFETVLRQWTEYVFATELIETGSVPGLRNDHGMPVQSYSPDGIGIVKRNKIAHVLENENIKFTQTDEYQALMSNQDDSIVLFEFKCPLLRKPDGAVPKQYKAQPRLGMNTLSIPEFAIFGDAMFRKCSMDDFNFESTFDHSLPSTARKNEKKENPVALGIIGVYEEDGRTKTKGNDTDMRIVTKSIYSGIATFLSSKDYAGLKQDVNLVTLAAVVLYDAAMDNEFEKIEFDEDTRIKILWNAIRMRIPDISNMSRDEGYKLVYAAIRLIDTTRRTVSNLKDLNFGIDLGYTKSTKDSKFGEYHECPPETLTEALSSYSLTADEFYSLLIQVNNPDNTLGLKYYYPGKFCYQQSNPYATELMRNGNLMDGNLKSSKQCRKWLWQNVKEFEQFCFEGGHKPIGIIPYKLLNIKFMPVYKEHDYLNKIEPLIKEFQINIEKCRIGTNDPVVMDRRVCDIFNIAPLVAITVEENTFDDVDFENHNLIPVSLDAAVITASHGTGMNFDDLDLIG